MVNNRENDVYKPPKGIPMPTKHKSAAKKRPERLSQK
jgi:hypothetical protein